MKTNRMAIVAALAGIAALAKAHEPLGPGYIQVRKLEQSPTRRAEKIAAAEAKRARKAQKRKSKGAQEEKAE